MDACAGGARGSVPKSEGENGYKGGESEFQDILEDKAKGGKMVTMCVYKPAGVYLCMFK